MSIGIVMMIVGFIAGYWLGQQVYITGCDDDI